MVTRPPIRALLLDLSGTLHIGSQAVPGAIDALHRLRQHGLPFRLCSNTSKEGRPELRARLRDMGFHVHDPVAAGSAGEELWTSLGAVGELAAKLGCKRPYYLLSPSAQEDISRSLPSATEEAPYDAVIVGLAPKVLDYAHLNTAFQILTRQHSSEAGSQELQVSFLATHRGKYMRDEKGLLSMGPGPFITALENASGLQARVAGKPTRDFFEVVIDSSCLPLGDGAIAIVGDDIETDLGGGALELGLWRVLVRTGKYRLGDEHRSGQVPPDEVHESVVSFIDELLQPT